MRLSISLVVTLALCAPLSAQVVQLPTWRVFSVNTAVSIPDQGGAYLGGVNRSATRTSRRGLPLLGPTSRITSHQVGGSNVFATATIIDHREWDQAVLAAAGQSVDGVATTRNDRAQRASRLAKHIRKKPASGISTTPRPKSSGTSVAEAKRLIELGDQNLAEGKVSVARIFYRTALRRGDQSIRTAIQSRLAKLDR